MKFFAAGLLFVNLVFAIWYSLKPAQNVSIPQADPGVELLVMVNEPAPSQTEAVAGSGEGDSEPSPEPDISAVAQSQVGSQDKEASISQSSPVPAQSRSEDDVCYIMSLFDSRQSAESAMTELQKAAYRVRLTTRYSSKVTYLVYLPAYADASEARKITRELEEKGQSDFQILPIKGKRHSISLGIYSQPHTAEARKKQIESLGYSPLVEPVYGTPMGFQLEFNKPDMSRLSSAEMSRLIAIFKNLTIRQQKCGS